MESHLSVTAAQCLKAQLEIILSKWIKLIVVDAVENY